MLAGDIPPDRLRDVGPFALCDTLAEVLVLARAELGLEAVDALLPGLDCTRESLREAANEVKRAGLIDLALLLRQHAKKAKPAPVNFKRRWTHRSFKK
jgi:hypothetical protein